MQLASTLARYAAAAALVFAPVAIAADMTKTLRVAFSTAETGFDPRTRPWYRLAVAADGVAWSDAYVFFTDGKPGITASLAMRDGGGRTRAVIGADLHLDRLSTFLRGLKIGNTGRAMIVDDQQLLIAFSGDAAVARRDGTTLRRTQIDELGERHVLDDAALVRITERWSCPISQRVAGLIAELKLQQSDNKKPMIDIKPFRHRHPIAF